MKMRLFFSTLCALLLSLLPAVSAPVQFSVNASFEGLGTSAQQPLAAGVIEIGWLDVGTTFNDMIGFLTPGGGSFNVATARDRFNSVATMTFSAGSPNSFGSGLVQENLVLVPDGNAAALASYQAAATGPAGKRLFCWIRNDANEATASQQAFVDSTLNFPPATDTVLFTDFAGSVDLDSSFLSANDIGVGALVPVTFGGGIDTNDGSPADGQGLFGGLNVLLLEAFITTPTVGFAPVTASVQETAGTVTLTVARSGSLAGTMSVNYTTVAGSAAAGTDFTTTSGTLSFAINDASETIPVPILDRLGLQGARQFTVVLSGVVGGDIGAGTATVTINDEVRAGTLRLSAATYTQAEGNAAGTLGVTVQRVGGSDGVLGGTLTTTDGTAVSSGGGADFTALVAQAVSFPEGDTVDRTVLIQIAGDTTFEPDENFTVTLAGAAVSAPTVATVTLTNDDMVPTIGTLNFANAGVFSAPENAGTVTVTVERLAGSVGDTSVTYAVAGGSAVAGTDYNGTASPLTGTLSWVGADTTPKSFQIALVDNGQDAPDKTFQVTLSNPLNGAIIVGPNPATVTIVDDDLPVTLSFDVAAETVGEAGKQVELVIQRGGSTAGSVFVVFSTSGLTTADYTPIVNKLITFAPGEAAKSIFVKVKNRSAYQGDRAFNATLFNPGGGAVLGANPVEAITILEDDLPKPGKFTLSTTSYSGREAAVPPQILFTVVRSGGSDLAVSVDYTLTQLSATQGVDYTGLGGTLNFAQRETKKVIAVPIIDDTEIEAQETLSVALSNPTNGATLGTRTTATLKINDNDVIGTFAIEPLTQNVNEGATATVRVLRIGELQKTFVVNYRTVAGTASTGQDFVATAGTLTFDPNVTELPVTIPTVDDPLAEGDESFTVVLSLPAFPPQTAVVSTRSSAKITINRSDATLQPDGLVAVKGGPFIGKNVYNSTGDGQIAAKIGSGSGTSTFLVRVINDGNVPDTYLVKGVGSGTAGYVGSVRYYRAGKDITFSVASNGYAIPNMPVGGEVDIEVRVSLAGAKKFTGYGATITTSSAIITSSTITTGTSDVVRVIAIAQ